MLTYLFLMIGLVGFTIMQTPVSSSIGNHFLGLCSINVSLNNTVILNIPPISRDEIANNVLGSQAGESLLHELKPKYWFSAHLHCRFAATVQHNEEQATQFLALDKCLPRRQYLEVSLNWSLNHAFLKLW